MYSAVLLVTDEGRVEFANQAFCDCYGLEDARRLVGIGNREMIKKIRIAYLHPDEAIARIREILDRGEPVRDEEIAMQGGRTCLRDFVPLNVQGKSYGRLWLHFDITERKQAEEARKGRPTNWPRSNQDLDQFASVASHDLQEPLRSVSGFVQLLQKDYAGRLDANADSYIGYAVDGTRRMEALIRTCWLTPGWAPAAGSRADRRRRGAAAGPGQPPREHPRDGSRNHIRPVADRRSR